MGRKNGCKCAGHWKSRRANWRVTEDRKAKVDGEYKPSRYSEVQCRSCRRMWRTDARHIATLPRHQKRQYDRLTEVDVFALIKQGRIRADKEGRIWKQKKHFDWRPQFILLTQTMDDSDRGGYLFVDIKHNGARKRFAAHRVIWMATHRKLIPDGYEVDHKNRVRTDNAPLNLRILTRAENHPTRQIPF